MTVTISGVASPMGFKKNESHFINYEEIMRNITRKSQIESFKMRERLGVQGTEFDTSSTEAIEDFEETAAVSMDIFDSLNGIDRSDYDSQFYGGGGYPYDPFSGGNNGFPL